MNEGGREMVRVNISHKAKSKCYTNFSPFSILSDVQEWNDECPKIHDQEEEKIKMPLSILWGQWSTNVDIRRNVLCVQLVSSSQLTFISHTAIAVGTRFLFGLYPHFTWINCFLAVFVVYIVWSWIDRKDVNLLVSPSLSWESFQQLYMKVCLAVRPDTCLKHILCRQRMDREQVMSGLW